MAGNFNGGIAVGDLIRVRGREWAVEATAADPNIEGPYTLDLACIDDDAQGERLQTEGQPHSTRARLDDPIRRIQAQCSTGSAAL